jgi:hypothetical protein
MDTILHIGASKAASSFLQDNVFGGLGQTPYYGPASKYTSRAVKWIIGSNEEKPSSNESIISHEGLSIHRDKTETQLAKK